MGFICRTCCKEEEALAFARKGNCDRFLGRASSDPCWLLGEGKNHCRSILKLIQCRFEEKTTTIGKEKVLFHYDKTPAHTSAVPSVKLVEVHYELLTHPYFPILAPRDLFLFRTLRYRSLKRSTGRTSKSVFYRATKAYYADGLKMLHQRWKNVRVQSELYIEK